MKLTKKQTAEAFSNGNFEKTYPYLSANIEWNVINNYHLIGKNEVIQQCEKVAEYLGSITTDFQQLDAIENTHKVIITGTAELSKNGVRIESISACDIYQFSDHHMLQKISSYCLAN